MPRTDSSKYRKFKKHRKYPGTRSIPLRNPRRVDMFRADPQTGKLERLYNPPSSGPTEECFDADAKWYAVKEGRLVRITGEPEEKPQFVVIDRRKDDMELRLYYFGTDYFFVQLYYCIEKVFLSVTYRGRKAAVDAYSNGDIRWSSSKPIAQGEITKEKR